MSFSSAEHFTCIVCDRFFKDLNVLQLHMGAHAKEVGSKCSICGKGLRNRNIFSEHMYVHTDEELFRCTVCCKSFEDKLKLTEHMRIHVVEKHFQCVVCHKTFKYRGASYKHMIDHTNKKPCNCNGDHVAFEEKEVQQNKIVDEDYLFKCSVCDEAFSNRYLLKEHIGIHTTEKPFKCSVCSETFRLQSSLRKHTHGHSNEILYRCEVCFETFHDKDTRDVHMRMHISRCTACEREMMETELQGHLEICPANQPYECNSQKGVSRTKPFKRQNTESLMESRKQFRSARYNAFKCNICGKRFSDSGFFKDHMREHSKEESCKCKVCGEALFSKQEAQRHKELHKKVTTVSISQSNGDQALPSYTSVKPTICDRDCLEQPEQNSFYLKAKMEDEEDYSSSFPNSVKEEHLFSEDKKDFDDPDMFVSDVDSSNVILMVGEEKDVCIDESLVDPLA